MSAEGYTVKERLEQLATTIAEQLTGIVRQLDLIDEKLDSKASNHRVDDLEKQIGKMIERIVALELKAAGTAAITGYQRWLVGGLGAAIVGALIYVLFGSH